MSRLSAVLGSAVFVVACAAPPPPAPVSAPVVEASPREAAAPADAGPPVESVPAVEATPADAGPPVDPCRGSAFDLDALPDACRVSDRAKPASGMVATLTLDRESVRAGEEVQAKLTFTNETADDKELVIKPGCADVELQAFKANKRADWINPSCGFGTGCGGPVYRLVLVSGGTLTKRARYAARLVRYDRSCHRVEAPLPAGRYELRAEASPFFGLQDAVTKVRAPLVVERSGGGAGK